MKGQMPNATVIDEGDTAWVNHKMAQMTLDEKLGQLSMVAADSNKGASHKQEIMNLVKKTRRWPHLFSGWPGSPGTSYQYLSAECQNTADDHYGC
ncbi:MAG: hypothetical protein U5L96_11125 [Owenweeksia sp.]|nr:hypothetical protein [Owenweeksia sp.]